MTPKKMPAQFLDREILADGLAITQTNGFSIEVHNIEATAIGIFAVLVQNGSTIFLPWNSIQIVRFQGAVKTRHRK